MKFFLLLVLYIGGVGIAIIIGFIICCLFIIKRRNKAYEPRRSTHIILANDISNKLKDDSSNATKVSTDNGSNVNIKMNSVDSKSKSRSKTNRIVNNDQRSATIIVNDAKNASNSDLKNNIGVQNENLNGINANMKEDEKEKELSPDIGITQGFQFIATDLINTEEGNIAANNNNNMNKEEMQEGIQNNNNNNDAPGMGINENANGSDYIPPIQKGYDASKVLMDQSHASSQHSNHMQSMQTIPNVNNILARNINNSHAHAMSMDSKMINNNNQNIHKKLARIEAPGMEGKNMVGETNDYSDESSSNEDGTKNGTTTNKKDNNAIIRHQSTDVIMQMAKTPNAPNENLIDKNQHKLSVASDIVGYQKNGKNGKKSNKNNNNNLISMEMESLKAKHDQVQSDEILSRELEDQEIAMEVLTDMGMNENENEKKEGNNEKEPKETKK